jgi:hypothetical protein
MIHVTLTLSHKKLIARNCREVKKLRRLLLGRMPRSVERIAVQHQIDWSCCAAENWDVTFTSILEALKLKARCITLGRAPKGEQN